MFSPEATQVSKSALLPYAAEDLFSLVNDIESYPTFLDGCNHAEILNAEGDTLEARLHLNKKGIQQSFTTKNQLFPNERISMELVEGPFETLSGEWKIQELGGEGCKLSLDLEFTPGKSLVMKLAAPFFAEMGNRLVDAVVEEAGRRFSKQAVV